MSDENRSKVVRKKIISIGTSLLKEKLSKEINEEDIVYFLDDLDSQNEVKKDYEYIRELLEIARIDWCASSKLYSEGIYSQSTYHLQQCVEKVTKAYFLYTGYITIEELKPGRKSKKESLLKKFIFWRKDKQEYIGHISPKAFLILLSKKQFEKRVQFFLKLSSSKEDVRVINKQVKKIIEKKKELELCKISSSQIKEIISFYDSVNRVVKSQKNALKVKILSFVNSLDIKSQDIKELSDEEKKSIAKDFSKYRKIKDFMLDAPINSLFLWLLSVITFPHFNYTRYPGNKNFNYNDYTNELGIISCQGTLLKIIDRRLLKRLSHMVDMEERIFTKKEKNQ